MPQAVAVDDTVYQILKGGRVGLKYQRDQEYYNEIIPNEQKNLTNTIFPTQLTFVFPCVDYMVTERSKFMYSVGVLLPAPSTAITYTYYIKNNHIFRASSAGGSDTQITTIPLPISARQILIDTQINKDNQKNAPLDIKQQMVFRDNSYLKMLSQGYIASQSNTYFLNTDQHTIAIKNQGDADQSYLHFQVPIEQVHTMFNILPLFPFKLLNSQITLVTNLQNIYDTAFNQFFGFKIRMCLISHPEMHKILMSQQLDWTYQQYDTYIQPQQQSATFSFNIQQAYKSLDMIQLQMFTYKTNLYRNGFSVVATSDDNLFGSTYSAANIKKKISFGNLNFEYNGRNIFTKQPSTFQDLLNLTFEDGNLEYSINNYLNTTARPDEWQAYINQVILKLDDFLDKEVQGGSANYTGLPINSSSNAVLSCNVTTYNDQLVVPTQSQSTDNVNIQITLFYSSMLSLKEGDLWLSVTK